MSEFPPLSGADRSSFAYLTIKDRLPEILTKVVDVMARRASQLTRDGNQDEAEDAKQIVAQLSKLKNEMQTDKPILLLTDDGDDVGVWNDFITHRLLCVVSETTTPSWYTCPWLSCECYMYRRIRSILNTSSHHRGLDPFTEQKTSALVSSQQAMSNLAVNLKSILERPLSEGLDIYSDLKVDFIVLLEYCLWGNKCDLSLSGGAESNHQLLKMSQLKNLMESILCNDTEAVWVHLASRGLPGRSVRVDFVLDNAGFELFTDMCLADFLFERGLAHHICLHVKVSPWFVSDATRQDLQYMLDYCRGSSCAAISMLGNRWSLRLEQGDFQVVEHPFYCYPYSFRDMASISPDLYAQLAKSDLVIFKGDLNYRKLVGDLSWPATTSFSEALQGFQPAPLCSLRTLKADVVVGLEKGVEELTAKKDANWMVNGNFAVIQFDRATV